MNLLVPLFMLIVPTALWAWIGRLIPYGCPPNFANRDILLAIAHPDDEVMFFGPTLALLSNAVFNNTVSILCLTSGNAEGIGHIRRQELQASALQFGIPAESVSIIDDLRLPDSQDTEWDVSLVEKYLETALDKTKASILLTFDDGGVSDHPNHRALSTAASTFVDRLVESKPADQAEEKLHLQVWKLKTVSIIRKYTMLFDAFYTYYIESMVYKILDQIKLLIPPIYLEKLPFTWPSHESSSQAQLIIVSRRVQYDMVKDTMVRAHKSQMKWFRHGWLLFSRYLVVNDLYRE